jgi:predicted DNA-binding transcriptional regulator AlpA
MRYESLPQMPDGRPVPMFFGRRFLTARELIETGLVRNLMTLRRLIAEGRFPPPLALGRRMRLWDTIELQNMIDRLREEAILR